MTQPSLINMDLPYDYPIQVTIPSTTPAQGTVGGQVSIQNDADFECREIVASSILSTGAEGLFALVVTDGYRSRPLMVQTVPIFGENFAGTAQLPKYLVKPYYLPRTCTLSVQFYDRSFAGGGATNTVQLVFRGYKLFSQPPMQ